MANINNLDKNKLDKILEKLHYLEMVIRNLKERHDSYLVDVEGVDESLFKEIANYEMLTEDMKKIFLGLLMDDARAIAKSALQKPDFHEKAAEMLYGIERMLESLYKHERVDIEKSEALRDLTIKAKHELHKIKAEMENKLEQIEDEEKELSSAKSRDRGLDIGG